MKGKRNPPIEAKGFKEVEKAMDEAERSNLIVFIIKYFSQKRNLVKKYTSPIEYEADIVLGQNYACYLDGITLTGGDYLLRQGDPNWRIIGK